MNIRFLITAAIAATSITVFAQKPPTGGAGHAGAPGQHGQGQRGPGGPGGMRRGGMPDDLKKELNFTPAQEKQMKAIRDKYDAKLKAAGFVRPQPGQKPGGARPDFSKFMPIFQAQRKEMEAVYTPKQKDIMKKYMEAHGFKGGPGGMRMGGPGGKGGPPPTGAKGGTGHGGGH